MPSPSRPGRPPWRSSGPGTCRPPAGRWTRTCSTRRRVSGDRARSAARPRPSRSAGRAGWWSCARPTPSPPGSPTAPGAACPSTTAASCSATWTRAWPSCATAWPWPDGSAARSGPELEVAAPGRAEAGPPAGAGRIRPGPDAGADVGHPGALLLALVPGLDPVDGGGQDLGLLPLGHALDQPEPQPVGGVQDQDVAGSRPAVLPAGIG